MGCEWVTHKLEDCLAALIDYRGKTPRKVDSGIPLVTAKIVKAGRIQAPTEYIAEADYSSWMTRGFPECGDVVMTTEAPLGEVGQIQQLPVALAQRIVTLRGREGVLASSYLLYALQSEVMQSRLRDRSSGTTVLGIKQSELRKVEIDLPPIEYQREIASILSCLDDRIDLLRQTNTTLEAIAQALFKSWFVDFDPSRAKTEGREPEGMDATTAALFPSEFEGSELELIPKGWKVERLEAQLELAYGKALKAADRSEGDIPVYGSGGITGFHDTALISGPAIIVGRKGSVGKIYWEAHPCFPIDTVFYVKQKGCPMTFLFYLLQGLGLEQMNTDAAVPGLNRNNVYRLPVIAPPPAILAVWDDVASKIRKKITDATDQTKTLVDLRDTLLPRLISGKLRLPEAMVATQEALA